MAREVTAANVKRLLDEGKNDMRDRKFTEAQLKDIDAALDTLAIGILWLTGSNTAQVTLALFPQYSQQIKTTAALTEAGEADKAMQEAFCT